MATNQNLPATDSAAVLHELVGDDATAAFESDPKFVNSDPTADSSSENLQTREDRKDIQAQPDLPLNAAAAEEEDDEEDEEDLDDEDDEDEDDDLDEDEDDDEDLDDEDDEDDDDDDEYDDDDDSDDVDDEDEDA